MFGIFMSSSCQGVLVQFSVFSVLGQSQGITSIVSMPGTWPSGTDLLNKIKGLLQLLVQSSNFRWLSNFDGLSAWSRIENPRN